MEQQKKYEEYIEKGYTYVGDIYARSAAYSPQLCFKIQINLPIGLIPKFEEKIAKGMTVRELIELQNILEILIQSPNLNYEEICTQALDCNINELIELFNNLKNQSTKHLR